MPIDKIEIRHKLDDYVWQNPGRHIEQNPLSSTLRKRPCNYHEVTQSLTQRPINWGTDHGYRGCYAQAPSTSLDHFLPTPMNNGFTHVSHPRVPEKGISYKPPGNSSSPHYRGNQTKFIIRPDRFSSWEDVAYGLETVAGHELPLPLYQVSRIDFTFDIGLPYEVVKRRLYIKNMRKCAVHFEGTEVQTTSFGTGGSGIVIKCYDKAAKERLPYPLTRIEVSYQKPEYILRDLGCHHLGDLRDALVNMVLREHAMETIWGRAILGGAPVFRYNPDNTTGSPMTPELFDKIKRVGYLQAIYEKCGYNMLRKECHPRGAKTNVHRDVLQLQGAHDEHLIRDSYRWRLARFLSVEKTLMEQEDRRHELPSTPIFLENRDIMTTCSAQN